jgi:hypothetical protein
MTVLSEAQSPSSYVSLSLSTVNSSFAGVVFLRNSVNGKTMMREDLSGKMGLGKAKIHKIR